MNRSLLLGLVALFMLSCNSNINDNQRLPASDLQESSDDLRVNVIYGEDSRKDYYQVNSSMQELADSTVALVRKDRLEEVAGVGYNFDLSNYGKDMRLCSTETFYEQDTLAFCSGSLVGEDLILTAGHCILTSSECRDTSFVFGFAYKEKSQQPRMAGVDDVYHCAEVIHTELTSDGSDFAVVRLDRKVRGRRALSVERQHKAQSSDELVVIGHPSGLPTKVAEGASVRKDSGTYFVANLDTYGGNSGSAVFDARTNNIVGVLVRGETDFVSNGSCSVSNRCSDSGCRGEDVTHVSRALAYIPDHVSEPSQPVSDGATFKVEGPLEIPDYDKNGIVSKLDVPIAPKGKSLKVGININHTWQGDLKLSLMGPNGVEVNLHLRSGGSKNDLVGIYGESLDPIESLDELAAISKPGVWTLKVSDHASRDYGVLNAWAIIIE